MEEDDLGAAAVESMFDHASCEARIRQRARGGREGEPVDACSVPTRNPMAYTYLGTALTRLLTAPRQTG